MQAERVTGTLRTSVVSTPLLGPVPKPLRCNERVNARVKPFQSETDPSLYQSQCFKHLKKKQ